MDFYRLPLDAAMASYAEASKSGKTPTLTEQLLYAIMAQLDKANSQLESLIEKLDHNGGINP